MKYYKDHRIIDGKSRQVIIDETGKIINRNPSKDELKGLEKEIVKDCRFRKESYNDTNTCDRCGINFDKAPGHPLREHNEDGNWTGGWICYKCWKRDYDKIYEGDPGDILGDNCEELTHKWLGAKRLSVEYDNYSKLPLDHLPIPDGVSIKIGDKLVDLSGKIVQTKGATFDQYSKRWNFDMKNEIAKEFDYEICYCASGDGETIKRTYIISSWELLKFGSNLKIYEDWSKCYRLSIFESIEKYRISNELNNHVNNIFQTIRR